MVIKLFSDCTEMPSAPPDVTVRIITGDDKKLVVRQTSKSQILTWYLQISDARQSSSRTPSLKQYREYFKAASRTHVHKLPEARSAVRMILTNRKIDSLYNISMKCSFKNLITCLIQSCSTSHDLSSNKSHIDQRFLASQKASTILYSINSIKNVQKPSF